jgi:hypothetical protein
MHDSLHDIIMKFKFIMISHKVGIINICETGNGAVYMVFMYTLLGS